MWQQESDEPYYSDYSEDSIAAVFEALCSMLQTSAFDCSEHIYEQLARFLVRYFDEMTTDNPDTSARCLVALDGLRRDTCPVIAELARSRGALETVLLEAPFVIDHLTDFSKRALQRLLGSSSWSRYSRDLDRVPRDSWANRHSMGRGLNRALDGTNLRLLTAPEDGRYLQLNFAKTGGSSLSRLPLRPRGYLDGGVGSLLEDDYDDCDYSFGPGRYLPRAGLLEDGDAWGERVTGHRRSLLTGTTLLPQQRGNLVF